MTEQEEDGYTYTAGYESTADQTRSAEGGVLVVDDRSSEDIVKKLTRRVDIINIDFSKILVTLEDLKKENLDQNVKAQLSAIETRLTDSTQQALANLQKKFEKKLEGLSRNIDEESTKLEALAENIDEESTKLEALAENIDQESTKLEALAENIDQESTRIENTLENFSRNMGELSGQLQMLQMFYVTSRAHQHHLLITTLSEQVRELQSRVSALEGNPEPSDYMPPEQDDELHLADYS